MILCRKRFCYYYFYYYYYYYYYCYYYYYHYYYYYYYYFYVIIISELSQKRNSVSRHKDGQWFHHRCYMMNTMCAVLLANLLRAYIFINKVSFANVQVLDRLFLELCTGYTTECVI